MYVRRSWLAFFLCHQIQLQNLGMRHWQLRGKTGKFSRRTRSSAPPPCGRVRSLEVEVSITRVQTELSETSSFASREFPAIHFPFCSLMPQAPGNAMQLLFQEVGQAQDSGSGADSVTVRGSRAQNKRGKPQAARK